VRTRPISTGFFRQPVENVAPALLGALLISRVDGRLTAGRIVETEAYLGREDPASHGYQLRRNARNDALYGAAGSWYVYLSYGVHWCLNLVCGPAGEGGAVLIRALEPCLGIEVMRRRRNASKGELQALCSGPGKLSQALGISLALNGQSMRDTCVTVGRETVVRPSQFVRTTRIGITQAADWPLRFVVARSPWASRATTLGRR